MKKICILAVFQIVMGCSIAAYCFFFNVDKLRNQELAIGNNLLEYGRSIENNKKLFETSADNFFKIGDSLSSLADKCEAFAQKIKKIPMAKKYAPIIFKLHEAMVEQASAIQKSQQGFPQMSQTLDKTRENLNNAGNLLVNDSPVNTICPHVKFIGILLAAMFIINGIAFLLIAKGKE